MKTVFVMSLVYCLMGCGLLETTKDSNEGGEGSDENTTLQFDPNNPNEQKLSPSAASALSGASVVFPPGSLSISTSITVQEGASSAHDVVLGDFGIGDTTIESSAPALMVTSEDNVEADNPFTLSLPVPAATGLRLTNANLIVIGTYYAKGKVYRALFAGDALSLEDGNVVLQTKYFGKYQAVYISQPLENVPERKEISEKILSKKEVDAGETPSWTNLAVSFDEETRTISMSGNVQGLADLQRCAITIDNNKEKPYTFVQFFSEPSGTIEMNFNEAFSAYGRLQCLDVNGKVALSEWTGKKDFPEADGTTFDKTVPTVADGTITTSIQSPTEFTVTWTTAEDNLTDTTKLKYGVYYSQLDNLNSVQDVLDNGTLFNDYLTDEDSVSITNAAPGGYYVNVLVRDKAGNLSIYDAESVVTCSQTLVDGEFRGCPLVNLDTVTTMAGATPGGAVKMTLGYTSSTPMMYFADPTDHAIYQYNLDTNTQTVLSGSSGTNGSVNSNLASSRFDQPYEIVFLNDMIYVADTGNHCIRKIDIVGDVVTTLAGSCGASGYTDDTGVAAAFSSPTGVTTDGTDLYIADFQNHRIRKITTAGVVTTVAGSGSNTTANGTGTGASFNGPKTLRYVDGDLFVSEDNFDTVRKINVMTTVVTTVTLPVGVNKVRSFASDGYHLYIADNDHTVGVFDMTDMFSFTKLAGQSGSASDVIGAIADARFNNVWGVVADHDGVYVIDQNNNKIKKITK